MLPHLVGRLLGVTIRPTVTHWARLHQQGAGKGYRRKLRFAVLQAKDAEAKGLVVTVDADKDPQRQKLKELIQAREEFEASDPPFPTVLERRIRMGKPGCSTTALPWRRRLVSRPTRYRTC